MRSLDRRVFCDVTEDIDRDPAVMDERNVTGRVRATIAKSCASTQKSCMAPRTPTSLDDLDRKLLDLLQQDAGRSLYQLGEAIGLSPSAVQRRLSRYRSSGV